MAPETQEYIHWCEFSPRSATQKLLTVEAKLSETPTRFRNALIARAFRHLEPTPNARTIADSMAPASLGDRQRGFGLLASRIWTPGGPDQLPQTYAQVASFARSCHHNDRYLCSGSLNVRS